MSAPHTKRFYKTVDTQAQGGGFAVTLDARVLKTPGKLQLIARSERHAKLIAAEWDAQDTQIKPHEMAVTRVYNVALERTPENRDMLVAELRKYAGTDLLCYRASEPSELVEHQNKEWDLWLDWAAEQGIALKTATGVVAVEQSEQALNRVSELSHDFADLELTLLAHFNAVFGSAILALAVMQGALGAEQAYDLSRLDADFQIERWGEDEEAAEVNAATRAEVIALARLLEAE